CAGDEQVLNIRLLNTGSLSSNLLNNSLSNRRRTSLKITNLQNIRSHLIGGDRTILNDGGPHLFGYVGVAHVVRTATATTSRGEYAGSDRDEVFGINRPVHR